MVKLILMICPITCFKKKSYFAPVYSNPIYFNPEKENNIYTTTKTTKETIEVD